MISWPSGVGAQNYALFDPGQEVWYGYTQGADTLVAAAIRIDSVHTAGADTFYHNYKVVEEVNGNVNCTNSPYGISWLGEAVQKRNDGSWIILNQQGDTLVFRPQGPSQTPWEVVSIPTGSISASIVSTTWASRLGLSDSVRTIQFQALDLMGNPAQHPLNQYQMLVSKNHGLWEAPDFRTFPDILTRWELMGLSQPQTRHQNITVREIFDWDIGDVFHYQYTNYLLTGGRDTTLRELKVLDKYISPANDSMYYRLALRSYYSFIDNYGQNFNSSFSFDTSYASFAIGGLASWPRPGAHANLSPDWRPWSEQVNEVRYPGQYQQMAFATHPAMPYAGSPVVWWSANQFNGRTQKRWFTIWEHAPDDSCLTIPYYFGFNPTDDYAEGIGLVHNWHYDPPVAENEVKLVFFQKGAETWGNPIDFNDLMSISVPASGSQWDLQLVPHPASENVTLQWTNGPESSTIRVYDFSGRLLSRWEAVNGFTLDVSQWAPGMYTLIGQFGDKSLKRRLTIVR